MLFATHTLAENSIEEEKKRGAMNGAAGSTMNATIAGGKGGQGLILVR